MAAEKKKFAIDIFSILDKLNQGDLHLWEKLSDEERKGFSAYIITRWMSGTSDPMQIIFVNELVNSQLFQLGPNHTELVCKLLACCGNRKRQRFSWIADSKGGKKGSSLALEVIKEFYDYSTREAKEVVGLLSNDDIYELADDLGWQPDELKKLKKELK